MNTCVQIYLNDISKLLLDTNLKKLQLLVHLKHWAPHVPTGNFDILHVHQDERGDNMCGQTEIKHSDQIFVDL